MHQFLTRENEVEQLKYDLAQIIPEKWSELRKVCQKVKGDSPPYRACKPKKFMPKIMFLCANTHPCFNPETGECVFDGKVGIWPFVEKIPAQ